MPPPPGDSDRDRVRDGCLRWLIAQRAPFAAFGGPPAVRGALLRAFGELASIVAVLLRRGDRSEPVARLGAFVADALDAFDWESQAIRDPGFLVPLLAIANAAQATGKDASALRAAVARRVALGVPDALELVPYRRLELVHLLARDGFAACGRAELGRLARAVLAALDKPPSAFSEHDGYALTHAVFYLCDDGARDASDVVTPDERARFGWLVAACARVALAEGALDVLAELLVAARLLALDEPWLTPAAFAYAARAQAADGSLPTFRGPRPEPDAQSRFLDRYHATLMWSYASITP